jgi:hypothetical protein
LPRYQPRYYKSFVLNLNDGAGALLGHGNSTVTYFARSSTGAHETNSPTKYSFANHTGFMAGFHFAAGPRVNHVRTADGSSTPSDRPSGSIL